LTLLQPLTAPPSLIPRPGFIRPLTPGLLAPVMAATSNSIVFLLTPSLLHPLLQSLLPPAVLKLSLLLLLPAILRLVLSPDLSGLPQLGLLQLVLLRLRLYST
jgi:hypothetical protein